VVEEPVHERTTHSCKYVLSDEIDRVLNNYNGEVDELMHHKSCDWIIMVQIRFSKVNVSLVNNWVKIPIFIKLEIRVKINSKVIKDQFNITDVWQEPKVDILLGIDLPALDSWELDAEHRSVQVRGEVDLNICYVEVSGRVLNISPSHSPLEKVVEHAKFVVVSVRQIGINIEIMWQEFLHCSLE